ncbi:hypothetical protein CISIN_1g0401632mg, partial [Citrus sinensis]
MRALTLIKDYIQALDPVWAQPEKIWISRFRVPNADR